MLGEVLSVLLLTAAGAPPEIRTARDLRALPLSEVQPSRPVRLSGVVTFCPPREKYFYLQDDTGGVRIEGGADRDLRPGDEVEVVGWPTTGTYLPEARAVKVVVRGQAPLPKPVSFTLSAEDTPYLDGQRVEVVAVVQRAWLHDRWLQLDLARGRGHAVIQILGPDLMRFKRAEALSGGVVRVRGVCKVNVKNRAVAGSVILVDDLAAIEQIEAPPAEPFVLLPTTARDLTLFNPDPIKARLAVRVDGVVTMNQGNRQFYVYDGTGVVYALFAEPVQLNRGDRVSVVGFPRLATDPLRLDNSRVRVTGTGPLPPALPQPPAAGQSGKLEGQVARFTGLVHETGRQGNWMTLTLVADGLMFTAVLVGSDALDTPPPAVGSKVEVAGVVTKQPLESVRRNAFAVLVSAGGVTVLEPPPAAPEPPPSSWWTGRRVAYLTTGFFGLFLLGGATVTALRVQVRRAAELARQKSEENQKLEGQLKVAARLEAVGRVAGGVAHDFNNILTVINGCAQLLDEEIASDPTHAATLAADIRRAGRLATVLTRLLLTFSRQCPVAPHPLDLNAVIADAAPILARLLGDRCALHVTAQPNLPPALAETGMLLQILINLAANAGEAMPTGGTFALSTTTPEPGWVRLAAADTGEGMTEEVQARAFERGFTTKPAGTGTGLSTVFDTVQTLGGRIRCRSALGRGTEFEVDLPASGPILALLPTRPTGEALGDQHDVPTESARQDDTMPTPMPADPALPPAPVVLLVEDDDAVRALVRLVLEQAGLRVLPVADPEEALRVLAGHAEPVNLLVTDLAMVGLNGRELAERVRAARPSVRVLFMSGHAPDETFLETVRAEHADFLHKPFAPRELTEVVWRLLAQPTA
jgi:two-component system, cell cycle sensor histidine kinase and response regulator CckA